MICGTCSQDKPETEFAFRSKSKGIRQTKCRACKREYNQRWYRSNEVAHKAHVNATRKPNRWWLYRLTEEDYAAMVADQDGKCAICNTVPKVLCVDHDHATGEIRGLLCHRCNKGLGHFYDDLRMLETAIEYLALARGSGVGSPKTD